MVTYKKVGGLHFFKCGRVGFSCYMSKRKSRQVWRDASGASIGDYAFAVCLGVVGGLVLFYGL
jgi:hypothetical protein